MQRGADPGDLRGIAQGLSSRFPDDSHWHDSDVTVKCGKLSLKCHKFVLHRTSLWFHNALDNPSKETVPTPSVIQLDDKPIQGDELVHMLVFCYTGDYLDDGPTSAVRWNARMYVLANDFGVRDLKHVATGKYTEASLTASIKDLANAIMDAYGATSGLDEEDEALRRIFVEQVADNRRLRNGHLKDFDRFLQHNPDLMSNVLHAISGA